MNFLAWNFRKQTYADKHLLVMDSSRYPIDWHVDWATIKHLPEGMNLEEKRNIALDFAGDGAIAWMDDDDWQHASRLEILASAIGDNEIAGTKNGSWINLDSRRIKKSTYKNILFNSCLVRTSAAKTEKFRTDVVGMGDSYWMIELLRKHSAVEVPDILHAWVSHHQNLMNPIRKQRWDDAVDITDTETLYALRAVSDGLNANI
jgi:glycosyltransferase involved in cell wall biosynthesis